MAERFDDMALTLLLDRDADPGSLVVTHVEQASDMLCALWLAPQRAVRARLVQARPDGSRSRLGLVPSFKPASLGHAPYTLATLYANAAYKHHLAARGNAQHVRLDAGQAAVTTAWPGRRAKWGVELYV